MSSIKIRTKRLDGNTQIRILIAHPMDQSRDNNQGADQLLPAYFIKRLTIKHKQNVIVESGLTANIAKNPYFAFLLKGGETGDSLVVSWTDNLNQTDSVETKIT